MYNDLIDIDNNPFIAQLEESEIEVKIPQTGMNRQLTIKQLESKRGNTPYENVQINLTKLTKTCFLEIQTNFVTGRIEHNVTHDLSLEENQKYVTLETAQLPMNKIKVAIKMMNQKGGLSKKNNWVSIFLKISDLAQPDHLYPTIKIRSRIVHPTVFAKSKKPRPDLGLQPNFLFHSERINHSFLYPIDETNRSEPFYYSSQMKNEPNNFSYFVVPAARRLPESIQMEDSDAEISGEEEATPDSAALSVPDENVIPLTPMSSIDLLMQQP